MAWDLHNLPSYSPSGILVPPAPPCPGLAHLGRVVTLRALGWYSPSHKAGLQGLAGQGRAAAGGLGWRLHLRGRGQVKGGQPLAFWAGQADQLTGGLGAWDRTGPLPGGCGSQGAGWHVHLTGCEGVLEKPPYGLVSDLPSVCVRLPL